MPIKKWLKPYEKRTDENRHLRPRLAIIEEIAIKTAPKWNAKKKKFVRPMTIAEACEEVWISDMTFRNWRNEDSKLQKYFEDVQLSHKEMVHTMMEDAALQNVMEWIAWWVKLRPLDKINVSLRYLEKTSPEFNPSLKVDVDSTNKSLVLWMSTSEMEQRAMEIALALWINFNPNDRNTRHSQGNPWEDQDVWTTGDASSVSSELPSEPTINAGGNS